MTSERTRPWYHYTSGPGLAGILRDGYIEPSDPRNGDAVEGRGAYGTSYPPSTRLGTIARNNWDGGWHDAVANGKMDHYIRCEVPVRDLRQHSGHGQGSRGEILVHPLGIDLTRYATTFGRVGRDPVASAQAYDPSHHSQQSPYPRSGHLPPGPWDDADDDADAAPGGLMGCHTGTNALGNDYTAFGDGSYHYDNLDGSSYDRHADGSATFTSPSGDVHEYPSAGLDDSGHDFEGHGYADGCADGWHDDGGEHGGSYDYDDYDCYDDDEW
eukprot:CAMPEP_0197924086 /NCGR_PEP_ID=MMETSP1439-20131203/95075_1 /TAXON_ID=66791 /ORGANISM="Gonyaulax spinifera, Strain CCMP409" /LENGTH=269 /DNA_ID=CAMNT_0043546487 /DNA_START=54 /DNA_END=863 /DNA_ORIENTATION=-